MIMIKIMKTPDLVHLMILGKGKCCLDHGFARPTLSVWSQVRVLNYSAIFECNKYDYLNRILLEK